MSDNKQETESITASRDEQGRRRLLKGLAIGAPTLITLSSRAAFGAICSPSGFVSVNPANASQAAIDRHSESSCGGWSPGAWSNPDSGNGDGGRDNWHAAGYNPNPRPGQTPADPDPTPFNDTTAFAGDSYSGSLHDALLNTGDQFRRHAAAALLNASFFRNGIYMPKADVIALFNAVRDGIGSFTTSSGNNVDLSHFGRDEFIAFIEQTYD